MLKNQSPKMKLQKMGYKVLATGTTMKNHQRQTTEKFANLPRRRGCP